MTLKKIILSVIVSPLVFIYMFVFPAMPSLICVAMVRIKSEVLLNGNAMVLWKDNSTTSKSWRGMMIEERDKKIIVYKIKTPISYPAGLRLKHTTRAILFLDELSRKWTHNAICYIHKSEPQEDIASDLDEHLQLIISTHAIYEYVIPLLEPMTQENKSVILFHLIKCLFLRRVL